jgi:type IV secretory pathway TraG/TraD family ATPase VirD4
MTDQALARLAASKDSTLVRAALQHAIDQMPLFGAWPKRLPGVPITFDHAGVISFDLEGHRLVLGDSGEGKGTSVFMPLLLHDVRGKNGRRAGMIVVDPKDGELVRLTRTVRTEMGSPVYTLDPFGLAGETDGCNPLNLLNPQDADFFARCAGLARAIVGEPDDDDGDGVQWKQRARQLMTGLIGYLVSTPAEEQTLIRLRSLIRATADAFEATCAAIANSPTALFIRETGSELLRLHKAPKELQGYMSVMSQSTEFTDDPRLARVLMRSTFDWRHVRESGATVYLTVPDRDLAMAAPWLRLMIETATQVLRNGHHTADRKRGAADVHLVVDEAKAFGPWRAMEEWLRALRSERISVHLAYQNLAQIRAVWGEGFTRMTAVKVIHFLGSNDVETCEWIAKLAGDTTIVDRSSTTSDGESWQINLSKQTGQSKTSQTGWSQHESDSTGDSLTDSLTDSTGRSHSYSSTKTTGWSHSVTIGSGFSHTSGSGTSSSFGNGNSSFGNSTNSGLSSSTSHSETSGTSGGTSEGDSYGTTIGHTKGRSLGKTTGRQVGRGASGGAAEGETSGEGIAVGSGKQTNTGLTYSERSRPLTVQEVRSLPSTKAVVFVARGPGVVVRKLHFHQNPALLLRILDARLSGAKAK